MGNFRGCQSTNYEVQVPHGVSLAKMADSIEVVFGVNIYVGLK